MTWSGRGNCVGFPQGVGNQRQDLVGGLTHAPGCVGAICEKIAQRKGNNLRLGYLHSSCNGLGSNLPGGRYERTGRGPLSQKFSDVADTPRSAATSRSQAHHDCVHLIEQAPKNLSREGFIRIKPKRFVLDDHRPNMEVLFHFLSHAG